ncbi:hypothetical protein [Nocardia rhizosphaerae]|uniref:Uncharacterized protein n=1 Tax=Nocardia rhizosphaerae TaxID=1691571 RepID=A0ABV8L3C4_9NOCA
MAKSDLHSLARDFAARLSNLLNKTVCNGIRLNASVEPGTAVVVVSNESKRQDLARTAGVPICHRGKAKLHLTISVRLALDDFSEYLMVVSSVMALSRAADGSGELLHYDYERHKEDGYTEAHLHVCACSDEWSALLPDTPLKKLHLPVGGWRFRPTLEDVIEFLIVEGLAEGRAGWQEVLDQSRLEFQMIQLRAAIRRHPDVAREALAKLEKEEQAKLAQ